MSLLDDENILLEDTGTAIANSYKDKVQKLVSEYLFDENVLKKNILRPLHVQVNNVSDFNDWLQNNSVKSYSLNIFKFNDLSDAALFVQHLTKPGTVHFSYISDIDESENKDAILNILTGICRMGTIDIKALLKENGAENYIIPYGVKSLNSSDFKFIFSDRIEIEQDAIVYNLYPNLTKDWMVYGDFLNSKAYQKLSFEEREKLYKTIRHN